VPEVTEEIHIAAPPQQVWSALIDWDRQGEWMLLTTVGAEEGEGRGVGARIRAVTGIPLPGGRRLGIADPMLFTRWEPPHRADVRHLGNVVRGTGTFQVHPDGAGTRFVWTEDLDLPLGLLGRLGWPLVRPATVLGVRLSLRRFADFARSH
jgi:carbon monoxide dehydrogenase subunit G